MREQEAMAEFRTCSRYSNLLIIWRIYSVPCFCLHPNSATRIGSRRASEFVLGIMQLQQ